MIPALGEVDTEESLELSGQIVSVDQCCLVLVRDPAYKEQRENDSRTHSIDLWPPHAYLPTHVHILKHAKHITHTQKKYKMHMYND